MLILDLEHGKESFERYVARLLNRLLWVEVTAHLKGSSIVRLGSQKWLRTMSHSVS